MTLSTTEFVAIVIIVVSVVIAIAGMILALGAYKASDDVSADALNAGADADRKKRKVTGIVLASLGGAGIIAGAVIYFASGGSDAEGVNAINERASQQFRQFVDSLEPASSDSDEALGEDQSESSDNVTRDTFAHQAARVVGERVEEQTDQPFVPQLTEATREKLNNDIAVNNLIETINAKKAEYQVSVR